MSNWDRDPLRALNDIVNDLWGSVAKDDAELEKLRAAARKAADEHAPIPVDALGTDPRRTRILPDADLWRTEEPETADAPKDGEEPEDMDGPKEKDEPQASLEALWYATDETVDWTEVLTHAEPDDGLTDPEEWHFLHEHAERVLAGDLAAYLEVLRRADPLRDLTPFAAEMQVKCGSADRAEVTFTAMPSYIDGRTEEERRRYLAQVSVRAARDLLALLPCCEVAVTAKLPDAAPALTVTYARSALQKARLQFIDPVAFCEQCGGSFGA